MSTIHITPAITIRKVANITNASAGQVECWFEAADTSMSGSFRAEFEITFIGGERATVPNNDYFKVLIIDDIL